MNLRRVPVSFWFWGLGLLVFHFLTIPPSPPPETFVDFRVFWLAGQKAWAHLSVYDITDHWQFKYPPLTALIFGATWSQLSFETATRIYFWLLWILWGAGIALFGREIKKDYPNTPNLLTQFSFFLLFWTAPLADELKIGQVNWFCLASLCTFTLGFDRWKRSQGGKLLLIALAAVGFQAKIYSLLMLLLPLALGEWTLLAGSLGMIALLNVGGLMLFHGPAMTLTEVHAWITTLTRSSGEILYWPDNISLLGSFGRWISPHWAPFLWLSAGLAYAVASLKLLPNAPRFWRTAWLALGIPLLTPLAWSYWLLLAYPAGALIALYLRGNPARPRTLLEKLLLGGCSAFALASCWAHRGIWSRVFGTPLTLVVLAVLLLLIRPPQTRKP